MTLRGLVCAGGGAVGAYQAGVLQYIHRYFHENGESPFKIFTGISCGSLNATFYAMHSHEAAEKSIDLVKAWHRFHVPQYHADLVYTVSKSWFRKFFTQGHQWSLLSSIPLKKMVSQHFNRESLETAFRKRTTLGLGVATTEIQSGYAVWFLEGENATEWDRYHSLGKKDKIKPRHIVASCAIPIFMPPVRIGAHYFLDGGLNLPRPISAAIGMGAKKIMVIRTNVFKSHSLPDYSPNYKPKLQDVAKLLIDVVGQDKTYAEIQQVQSLDHYAPGRYKKGRHPSPEIERVFKDENIEKNNYEPIDFCVISPSRNPSELLEEFCKTHRYKLKRTTHEFMFHRQYIALLIRLGYADAKKKHEELAIFFERENKGKEPKVV